MTPWMTLTCLGGLGLLIDWHVLEANICHAVVQQRIEPKVNSFCGSGRMYSNRSAATTQ